MGNENRGPTPTKKPRIALRPGMVQHGSVYAGPASYQDMAYKQAVDQLLAERAKKAKAAA